MSQPSRSDGSEPGPRGGSPRLPQLQTVRILLVDDDPQAAALIDMALADAPFDHTLEVAPTAGAGMARISTDSHDIYLIDQLLPDGEGIALIQRAKASGATKPFILMTGYGSAGLDEAASREGAADYVEKHMVAAHLERSIRYALRTWQATRALHDREEQLRQAQKMEAIGRLAGGVAHDFNNLLTAIIGYADLLSERVEGSGQIAREVGEIRKAADRAAALTRQLLAFSRKQFLNPSILDLNEATSGLLQMLPRVIGDHIRITTELAPQLARVRADATQMEQVFVNLVLNARDAMPAGGELTIETANVTLDEKRITDEGLRLAPGRYVMLLIRDNGTGMDASTRERAFEPFFTTKPKGKGTGLGLATVYGIVEQSGGAIGIESSPGAGTAISVYLPATDAVEQAPRPTPVAKAEDGGSEVLLLVEDNESVRALAAKALRRRGYTVHEARDAEAALTWWRDAGIRPKLLITDVMMPGLSGPSLAARLVDDYPSLLVLFMSGFTEEMKSADGPFLEGAPLLQKPFTPSQLAERVRVILDSAPKTA